MAQSRLHCHAAPIPEMQCCKFHHGNVNNTLPSDRRDLFLTGDFVNGFRQTFYITSSNARDGDSAIFGGVDRVLLCQSVHLLGLKARVGKHANLNTSALIKRNTPSGSPGM